MCVFVCICVRRSSFFSIKIGSISYYLTTALSAVQGFQECTRGRLAPKWACFSNVCPWFTVCKLSCFAILVVQVIQAARQGCVPHSCKSWGPCLIGCSVNPTVCCQTLITDPTALTSAFVEFGIPSTNKNHCKNYQVKY